MAQLMRMPPANFVPNQMRIVNRSGTPFAVSEAMDPKNPRYGEPGAVYGAVFYSNGTANAPTKRMAEIKLSTSRLNPPKLIAFGNKLTSLGAPAAPDTPPIPNMAASVADLTTKITAATTANDAYE